MSSARDQQSQIPKKRPFCLRCCKPVRVCLCSRLRFPPINNKIGITILQHNREKNHPLNSVRVANLGLKNLDVIEVSDINYLARFDVRPLSVLSNGINGGLGEWRSDSACNGGNTALGLGSEELDSDGVRECRVTCNCDHLLISMDKAAKPAAGNIGGALESPIGKTISSNGFSVKKIQRKKLTEIYHFEDFKEFEVTIPPGSALLFPSKDSVCLEEVDFEIKHLLVLDGTWAKARRMYYENPWLQFLPHLKLDMKTASLYSEVRHQPKVGCLSTIESIVCTLKGIGGDDTERLQSLLDVFESMVVDQRRCKQEKKMGID